MQALSRRNLTPIQTLTLNPLECKSGESDASLPEALAAKSSTVLGFVLERPHESNGGPESRLGL
jgi:hypothetical protein